MKSYAANESLSLNAEHYRNQLIKLGVAECYLSDTMNYTLLYKKLFKVMGPTAANKLQCQEVWQMQALNGNPASYDAFDNARTLKDTWGATIAHYAAWSGNIEALARVHHNYPGLMGEVSHKGATTAHYAAWSGNIEALVWVQHNYPYLMEKADNNGCTIAHCVARSGNIEAFTWVQQNYPGLMEKANNEGLSIAHYAAWSGNIEALARVHHNYPGLMEKADNNGGTIVHYAASSGNPETLTWVQQNYPGLMEKANNNGLTIAHYAAWSGNIEALVWVQPNYPYLMEKADNNGCTIAHCVARSGNIEAFTWVQQNYPGLMEKADNNGLTIAHHAARSGNIEAFVWVQQNYPDLMEKSNNEGLSIAHYVARSGNIEAFAWVQQNYPGLMEKADNNGGTIVHYAAVSGNPEILNKVLILNNTAPKLSRLTDDANTTRMLDTFLKALDTNYTLTRIEGLEAFSNSEDTVLDISLRLSRNIEIKRTKVLFVFLLLGQSQHQSSLSTLPLDVCTHILSHCLPEAVNVFRIREEIMQNVRPKDRALNIIQAEIQRLQASMQGFWNFNNPELAVNKINALGYLSKTIQFYHPPKQPRDNQSLTLDESIGKWRLHNEKWISTQESGFFSNSENKTARCIENVERVLNSKPHNCNGQVI